MINMKTQKLIWEQQIKNEYIKFQNFIDDNNMPKYKINFVDNKNMEVFYSMQVLTQKTPMILNVNMGFLVGEKGRHCQPTLFHEFTHMWDYNNLFQDKDLQDQKSILSLYTEFHASQIEFLRFMEFESINHIKTINPNDSFYEFDKEKTVFEFYDEKCQLLKESINKYKAETSTKNYKAVIDSYMYVFGIKSIYDKYVETIELPSIDSIFHENLIMIDSFLIKYNVNEIWDILLMCDKALNKMHILNFLEHN